MFLTPRKSTNATPSSFTKIEDRMNGLQREMNNLMSSFFNVGDVTTPLSFDSSIYPSVDLQEKDNKYLLDADVPGLLESDISIDFRNNTLTIKGEKKSESETKDAEYVCVERSYGSFNRDISFDEEVDPDNIKADLKNGVLHIELTKKNEAKTARKKIPIRH